MANPTVTVPIALVQGMLSGAHTNGTSSEVFLFDAGIDPGLLQNENACVTSTQYISLYRSLIERLDDESLGFFSRRLKRGSFSLIARSALGAPDLGTALRRIAHTFHLLQDDVILELTKKEHLTGLVFRFPATSIARPSFLDEMLLRVSWRLLAWLAGGQLNVERFDFAFPCPLHFDSYNKVFPAPSRFEQPHSGFWFDIAKLNFPVRRDAAALRIFLLDAQTNIIVPRRAEALTSTLVREYLQLTSPNWPDLVTTANALHLSTSTLQRRLTAEGTNFQSLKNELRRDVAIVRLNTSTVPLTVLAQELGFTDYAAFQRAFKCWTGCTPGSFRK